MKIIPVIDLLNGQVVHAIRGEREKYKPFKSLLTKGSNAADIARALMAETGSSQIYVADLDAILKKGNNCDIFPPLREQGASLLVDAGISDMDSAITVKRSGADKIILGSETLSDLKELAGIVEHFKAYDLIFSIDIAQGKVLSRSEDIKGVNPVTAIDIISGKGINSFILLTLDLVGSGGGPDVELMRKARKVFPSHTLISGGGVKVPAHLDQLKTAGADGALVATALHRGWITRNDLFHLCHL